MKFQGDITAIPITDVAQNLSANRKSGTLTLRHGVQARFVVFREGKLHSYSDHAGFSVPTWLEEKGLVDPEMLHPCVAKARKAKKKSLGEYLEESGALSAEDYRRSLKHLFEEMIYEVFSFREGTFEFRENEFLQEALDPELSGSGVELAVGPLVIESARRIDDWEAIRKCLPSDNDIYRITPSERTSILAELGEDDLARAAVELLDGTRTIREVISRIPASRFEGSRILADFVARKWARPLEGSTLLDNLGSLESTELKEKALLRLKAAFEREPGNRELLKRVASLSGELGNKEESAIFHKLLAPALLADEDADGAEKVLRQSLALNAKDLGTWQKLWALLQKRGDEKALLVFGRQMLRHLHKEGLDELARDHLVRLVELFPKERAFRFEHAQTIFQLGDRNGAVEELLVLARDSLKRNEYDEGERALAKVLEFDREHKRARELIEKVRSGKLARQRARRKSMLRTAMLCLALCGLGALVVYDYHVRREFMLTTRTVFAEGLLERGEYEKAITRLKEVKRKHLFSSIHFLEGREFLGAIEEARMRQELEKKKIPSLWPLPVTTPATQDAKKKAPEKAKR